MSDAEDRDLVRRHRAGDTSAFEGLVDRYQTVLFNIAFRMTGDREDARDITQTAFVRACEKLHQYDTSRRFFSWLCRISVNESLNVIERRGRRAFTDAATARDRTQASDPRTPEEEYGRGEVSERVQGAIMKLSAEHRQVIVLRHFASLSYQEIAAVLDIHERTVKSRLFSARGLLRGILQSQDVLDR